MEVKWVQPLLESYTVCFHTGRVWFDTSYGKTSKTQQLFGSALFYLGKNTQRFAEVFGEVGIVKY